MTTDIELKLLNATTPRGEIDFENLAGIARHLQELTLRIARTCVPSSTTGRPPALVSELSHLRLTGLTPGSTVLHAVRGRAPTLAVEHAADDLLDVRLREAVGGLAENRRPDWADGTISESVVAFGRVLRRAAPRSEFSVGNLGTVRLDSAEMDLAIWEPTSTLSTHETVVNGVLEAVDLRYNRFRIVDDLSQRIRLDDVRDADDVAALVGSRVQARGVGVRDGQEKLISIREPLLIAAPLPRAWTTHSGTDLSIELDKPGPSPGAGPELDDTEFDALLAHLRR